jgi:hypothetical protein
MPERMLSEVVIAGKAKYRSPVQLMGEKKRAEGWLKLAAEAHAKAKRMRTSYARRLALEEAAKYEELARQTNYGARDPRGGIPKPFKR